MVSFWTVCNIGCIFAEFLQLWKVAGAFLQYFCNLGCIFATFLQYLCNIFATFLQHFCSLQECPGSMQECPGSMQECPGSMQECPRSIAGALLCPGALQERYCVQERCRSVAGAGSLRCRSVAGAGTLRSRSAAGITKPRRDLGPEPLIRYMLCFMDFAEHSKSRKS